MLSAFSLILIAIIIYYFIISVGNLVRFSTNLSYMSTKYPNSYNSIALNTEYCEIPSPNMSITICNYSTRDMNTIFNAVENILFDTITLLSVVIGLLTLRVLDWLKFDL